jgi:stearoyl-CoA 9-desaturase NADPH oxidoreductase
MSMATGFRGASRHARSLARALTTPLLPDDVLGTLNPLWSRRAPRARVVRVVRETADTTTLFLRPGVPYAKHLPGQYAGIGLQVDGVWHWRTYSITSRPGDPLLQVTVTAVPGGLVSGRLAHETPVGAVVGIAAPEGEFTAPTGKPLFVTAGSGITPIMGMLRSRGMGGHDLANAVIVHIERTPEEVVFGHELRALPGVRVIEWHTAERGRPTPEQLDELVPDRPAREVLACGPGGLLDALTEAWPGVRVERFQPKRANHTAGTGGKVTLSASGIVAVVEPETPILPAGEAAGALMPSGCRMGICHTCVGKLVAGAVRDMQTGELHDAADQPGRPVRTCVSAPTGDCTLDL